MKNSTKDLHIVSFDVPYPPSYGGVIDVYFKIKALYESGIRVHLHCFEYGRAISDLLARICDSVNYYKRKTGIRFLFSSIPFIAVTRSNADLMKNLLKDNYPILFEGLHCCYHLTDSRLSNRKKLVRTHNIEHEYYSGLAVAEISFFKRLYFRSEARKLRRFEAVLQKADTLFAISAADCMYLRKKYGKVELLPAFHPDEKVKAEPGNGRFAFYHGNLEIAENSEAALFLINEVFNDLSIPLIVAGRNPPAKVLAAVRSNRNTEVKANISTEEIAFLVKQAQINILPTFQATGIKLKLLTALFNGRYCIVNKQMVAGTGLEDLCIVCDSAAQMKKEVLHYFQRSYGSESTSKRVQILNGEFSNLKNVRVVISKLSD